MYYDVVWVVLKWFGVVWCVLGCGGVFPRFPFSSVLIISCLFVYDSLQEAVSSFIHFNKYQFSAFGSFHDC